MQDMADDDTEEILPLDDATDVEAEGDETNPAPEEETDLVVTIDGETPAPVDDEEPDEDAVASAPGWAKKLRREREQMARRIKELEARPALPVPVADKALELGEKPTLQGSDYDPEKFEADLEAWQVRKVAVEQQRAKALEKTHADQSAWQARVSEFDKQGAKYRDFTAAKRSVMQAMTDQHQAALLDAALDAPKVVSYLGARPEQAKALAAITNPVRLGAEIARLEAKMTVERRAPQTTPEGAVRGSSPSPAATTANLVKLKAAAERTGDHTAYFAAKRQLNGQK